MRLVWTEKSLQDLDDVFDFYEPFSAGAGIDLVRGAMATAEQLVEFPEPGPSLEDDAGPSRYRHLVHKTLRLIYRVDDDLAKVIVLRVWDGRRDPGKLEIIDSEL